MSARMNEKQTAIYIYESAKTARQKANIQEQTRTLNCLLCRIKRSRTGVLKLFKTCPPFIMQTKLAPPLMIPTKLKPYHIKNLTTLKKTKVAKLLNKKNVIVF